MKNYIYAFYDLKSSSYRPLSVDFTAPDNMGVMFGRMVNDPSFDSFSKFDGLRLDCLGEFDDVTGCINSYSHPEIVIDCDAACAQALLYRKALKNGKDSTEK